MAILSINESWSGLSAGGNDKNRTAGATFTVLFDLGDPPTARPLLAAAASLPGARIPQIGESHPNDPWLRATRPQVRPLSPVLWEVTVEYRGPAGGASGEKDNPLTAPARRRWTWASSSEPIEIDQEGRPIVNSVGETFDQNPMIDVYDPELVIERNEATDDPRVRIEYRMAVNSDAFYGARPGQALMLPIEAEEVRQGDFVYWAKTYRIRFRPGPPGVEGADQARLAWHLRLLDQGTRYRAIPAEAGGRIRELIDDQGIPTSRKVLLDGAGMRLEGGKPVWLYFRTSPHLPFRPFRLEG